MMAELHRGTLRQTADGMRVEVPTLGRGTLYRFEVYDPVYGPTSSGTAVGDHGTHTHALDDALVDGLKVLVGVVNGVKDDLALLGVLTGQGA